VGVFNNRYLNGSGDRVEVGDDGTIGSELIVALCLAVVGRQPARPEGLRTGG
jgi:hypothetical protein